MPRQSSIVEKAETFMTVFLRDNLPEELTFHNAEHTREVVNAAIRIGKMSGLLEQEMEIVQLAAWFHDTGYCCRYYGHEDSSIQIAREFLAQEQYPVYLAERVISCIGATRFPQNPGSLLEEVLCDADLFHLSQPDYPAHEQALRREWATRLQKIYSDQEWAKTNCEMLLSHHYFTAYGKSVLQTLKEKNIATLRRRF